MVNVNAFVTLLTSDSYIQGVVALAHSLHLTHTHNELVCMVTEGISQEIIERLEKPGDLYDKVIRVDELDSKDQRNLELLGRPELGVTFTKLNVWKLCQYDFVAFLDADTIVLKNIDSLFDQIKEVYNHGDVPFLAAPDVGWPDNFNSGVFVCKPDLQTYSDLVNYSRTIGSYDGGDQGLLNRFFNKWNKTPNARLSFNYNVTPSAYYTYAPAFKEHQDNISVVHFIGNNKPWKSVRGNEMKKGKESNSSSSISKSSSPFDHLVSLWWNVYDNYTVCNPKGQGEFLKSYDQSISHSNVSINHPYDNAWYTKVIQEPNNLPIKELEIVESKEEQKIQNKGYNENENNNDDKNEYKNEDKTENEDFIKYKWQIRTETNENILPYNVSSNHPTDNAYITKIIKVDIYENEKENDDTMETQPRVLNIPENNISMPNQSEQKNIKEIILDDTPLNSSNKNITSVQQMEERIKENTNVSQNSISNYYTSIKTSNNDDDDFANYHISWNFNELRGFRKQYKKYLKETERPYISVNWNNKDEQVEADPRDTSILASEPTSEINEEKDDIMNISNLPGLHVSEFEDEGDEDEDLHEHSVNKNMTENGDINIENFDIYGFNYEVDIKKKSFTCDSNDEDISKNGGRRRRKSIIEVINGLDGLTISKMPDLNGEEDNAFVDKSVTVEEPFDVTGIIEDNFENDLFINEDEIENLSFVKNHNQHENQEYDNANRSFVSMNQKEIEKDNIIVEPIPSNEITELIANGNDTILPNDISNEEVVFVNDSIIPSDIIADNKEVTVNNFMIPSEILKPKVDIYDETETEITEVPKYNDMIIQVNDIEIQPQPFVSEFSSSSSKELLLSKSDKMLDKSISEENTLALEDPTIINNRFEKKIQTFLNDIPEKIEEVEEDEEKKEKKEKDEEKEKEKDQTILDSTIEDFTTEIISEESINEDIVTKNENIEIEPKSLCFNEVTEVIPANGSTEDARYSFITEPKYTIFTEVVQPIEKIHVDDEISEIEENVIEGESKEVTFREPTEEVYEIYIEDVTKYDSDSIDESNTKVKHVLDEKYEIVIEDVIQELGDNIDVNNKDIVLEDPKNEIYEEIIQQDDNDKKENIEVINKDDDITNLNQDEYVYEIEDFYYDDHKGTTVPMNDSYEIIIKDVIEDKPSKDNIEVNDRDAALKDPNQGISESIAEEKPQNESDVEATIHITEDIIENDKGKSINEITQANSTEDNLLENDFIVQEEPNEIESEEIISKQQNENIPDELLRKKIIIKKYIKRRILKPKEEKIDIENDESEQSIPIIKQEKEAERGYEQPIYITEQEQESKQETEHESEQESEQESVEEDYEDYTISRIEIHELIAEIESSSSEEGYDSEVNEKYAYLPQENEPTEACGIEASEPEQEIGRRRIIKRIIRRNGQTYMTETEEPIEDDEVEVSEESGSEQEIKPRRIIKRIIHRNGQTYVTESEGTLEDDEEVKIASKSVSSSQEKEVIEQNISQKAETVERDNIDNDKVVRKRIIKRIIRRNGQTYVTVTEEPIENDKDIEVSSKTITTPQEENVIEQIIPQEVEIIEKDDSDKIITDSQEAKTHEANEPAIEEVLKEVISSQKNKSEELKDERLVRRINYKNDYRVISYNQENSLERNMYTLIPSLTENDEVLLYTIIIFGKDQNKLFNQFENATNDFNLDKISAEEYYSIYITILNELCKDKGVNDDRYQSLNTPFMKEYSEKLWCSIANNLVKEDSFDKSIPKVKVDEDGDAIKKKRRSCLPFFRKRSKKRHSILSKHKKSKSVDANSKIIKINNKKQEMLEAKKKYIENENERNKIKQLNIDENINEENSEEVRTTDIKQIENPKEKEVDISEAPIIKQEEKNDIPETKSKTQMTIKEKIKNDNKKKEKKRWWKRIIGKKNNKKN